MAHKVGIHTVNDGPNGTPREYLYVSPIRPPGEVEGTRRLCTAVQWGATPVFGGVLLLVQENTTSGITLWRLYDRVTASLLGANPNLPDTIISGPEDDRVRDYSPRGKDVYSEGSIPEPE